MNAFNEIKLSLLIDNDTLNFWQFKIIENILETKNCKIDKIYYSIGSKSNIKPSWYQILKQLFVEILFFNTDYLKKINTQQIFSLSQKSSIAAEGFNDLNQLKSLLKKSTSDLLINLSNTTIPGDLTAHMKLGQAFFMFGESRFVNLHYSAFRNPSKILIELVWMNSRGAFVFNHGYVDRKNYSASETVDTCGNMTEDWIRPFLYRLMASPDDKPVFKNLIHENFDSEYRFYLIILFVLNIVLARFRHLFVRLRRAFTYQKWNILVAPLNKEDLIGFKHDAFKLRTPVFEADWPKSYADPFYLKIKGKSYIIYEDFDFKSYLGQISMLKFEQGLAKSTDKPVTLFSDGTHFSYPCIFEHLNKVYIIPENIHAKKISAFELDTENLTIKSENVLLDGSHFVDPTMFFKDDYFWILCSKWENYTHGSSKLYLYYSKSFLGPYTPHDLNPVVTDMSKARPAGNIFEYNGQFYRPSQDCVNRYGQKINISLIEKMTPHEYQEKLVQNIEPDVSYPLCCHHMSLTEEHIILDGQQEYFSLKIFFWKFKNFIFSEILK